MIGTSSHRRCLTKLVTDLVLPKELELGHGDEVGAGPDLDEEELTNGEQAPAVPLPLSAILILGRLVEGVGGMVPALRPHPLQTQR